MVTLFISYRRADTEAHAGRLYESLMNRLPDAEIFMDVDSLRAGEDFVEGLEKALSSAEVVLVIIGRQWLTVADDAGRFRLQDEKDFVRREVGRALARKMPVIPVLVQQAALPREDQMPEELRPLARRQAIELHHITWSDDVARLAEAIEFLSSRPGAGGDPAGSVRRVRLRRVGLARKSGLTDVLRGVRMSSAGWRYYAC